MKRLGRGAERFGPVRDRGVERCMFRRGCGLRVIRMSLGRTLSQHRTPWAPRQEAGAIVLPVPRIRVRAGRILALPETAGFSCLPALASPGGSPPGPQAQSRSITPHRLDRAWIQRALPLR